MLMQLGDWREHLKYAHFDLSMHIDQSGLKNNSTFFW